MQQEKVQYDDTYLLHFAKKKSVKIFLVCLFSSPQLNVTIWPPVSP